MKWHPPLAMLADKSRGQWGYCKDNGLRQTLLAGVEKKGWVRLPAQWTFLLHFPGGTNDCTHSRAGLFESGALDSFAILTPREQGSSKCKSQLSASGDN